jgi:hypothetical protein
VGPNATVADVKAFVQSREGEPGRARSAPSQSLLIVESALCGGPAAPDLAALAPRRQHAHTAPPSPSGVAPEDVYVVFNGKPLEESDLLSAAGVEEAATLNVLGRLLGGAKKRKKKTYTKPKKQKHKHKKIKLRVLKFYKVGAGAGRRGGCDGRGRGRALCGLVAIGQQPTAAAPL